MNETILAEAITVKTKKFLRLTIIFFLISFLADFLWAFIYAYGKEIGWFGWILEEMKWFYVHIGDFIFGDLYGWYCDLSPVLRLLGNLSYLLIYLSFAAWVSCLLIWLSTRKTKLTVSDKRVYGIASWGKRVDLPMDSISSVGTMSKWGICVATSSGTIKFRLIMNRDYIHSVISDLLLQRQTVGMKNTPVTPSVASSAEELLRYKELLDAGVINEAEFEAKKEQLLKL